MRAFLAFIFFLTLFLPQAFAAIPSNYDQEIALYLDLILKDPSKVELWENLARLEYQAQNYTLAIDAFCHAINLTPNNASLYKSISEIYGELNEPNNALIYLNKALLLKPNDPDYLLTRANIANWNKSFKIALDSYQRLLYLSNDKSKKITTLEILTQIGSLQSQLHLYPEAIKTYQEAIRINPNNALFYRLLSQNLAAINDPKQALKMINHALELDPINFEYIYSKETLSQWVDRIQHEERSIITGKSYIAPRPLSVFEQYLATANQEASLKHYHNAAPAMQQAIRLKPRDSLLYKKISEIYAMEQQPKLALSAINQAVKLEPRNIAYLRTRGELAGWAMDKAQLQDSYERILKLKPYEEDAMLQLAHAFAWQGQTDKAISAYVALLKLYPNNAEGWIEYAETLSWTGNYVGTLSALENYKHLKGETKVYCQTKARALALTGYFNSACAINEPLLKSYPNDPYILSTEITALIESFHLAKAIKVLEKLDNILIKENQVNALKKNTLVPLKSNVNLEVDYASASDTTRILDVPVYGQYFFNPTTSLLFHYKS